MPKIYLAGGITGLSYGDCTSWRTKAKDYVKSVSQGRVQTFSPLRFTESEPIAQSECIGHSYANSVHSTQCGIASRDRFDVLSCDLILINFLGAKLVSKNSLVELGIAAGHIDKLIVCLMESDNIHHGPLIDEFCQYIIEPRQDEDAGDCLCRGLDVCCQLLLPE